MMALLCVAPVAAAYWVFYFSPPSAHTNYGDLLEIKPLPQEPLTLIDGTPFNMSKLQGKWLLMMADSGHCDDYCRYKLFSLHQLRLGQGKNSERIERVWLVTDNVAPAPELLKEYPGTFVVKASNSNLLRTMPSQPLPVDNLFIIDPLGNWVLRYPHGADSAKIIKDLARLLAASRVG